MLVSPTSASSGMAAPYAPRAVQDLTTNPPTPHLIENVCRPTGSALLFGRTGIGKTRFLWQLALGWAQGLETFGLKPARPLRITFVEADMYRDDFESVIKEYAATGTPPSSNLCWFSREDETMYLIDGTFGKVLRDHNLSWDTDLTIYDAIPDITIGDGDKQQVAYTALRSLASASAGRAYLGVLVQRKGNTQFPEETESIDNMLGSQGWGRQASTVWQMTSVPSLLWVKHRLCPKPKPIMLAVDAQGVFHLRSAGAQGLIFQEAAKGFTSANELAHRVMALPEYQILTHAYKERALRELIALYIKQGKLILPGPETP